MTRQKQVEDFPENLYQTQNFISSPSPIVLSQSTPVNQIPNGNTEASEAQKAATKRKDRLLLFNQAILPFVNKQLDDEEWSTFEDLVNALTTDLKDLMVTSPRRHPTTHWKRRQHQHRRQQNNRSVSMGNNQPCSNRDNHSNHSHNRRRHSSRNAGKLQWWYRTNKKRCIRNILDGDDNLECEIPAVELQQYFSQPAPIPSTSPGPEGPPSTNS